MDLLTSPVAREELKSDMLDIANNIVGNVGPDVDDNFIKARRHELAFFCLHREEPDYEEIINTWTQWITAYREFKRLHRPEGCLLIDDPELVLRWMLEPAVDVMPKSVHIRAYLVIHRTDHDPVSAWKRKDKGGLTHKKEATPWKTQNVYSGLQNK